MLLRQADQLIGLTRSLDEVMVDPRDPLRVTHSQRELLAQRIYGIALGYEDLNDHDSLRHDRLLQCAVERPDELASSPTLCRLEARADSKLAMAFSQVLVQRFIDSFKEPPEELILDFDATDDRVHGTQEGRSFHGYYHGYCFLPLYVFCGNSCWSPICAPATLMVPSTPGRFSSCW